MLQSATVRIGLVALISATAVTPALAAERDSPFGSPAVSEQKLSDIRGGAGLSYATLTASYRQNSDAYNDLTAQNARIQMDVWWGTIGAGLIAQSVRAGT